MEDEEPTLVERERKSVVEKIAKLSEYLIDELMSMIEDPEVDDRVKLQAIGMILDRGVPKLAVENTKAEVNEESKSRKKMREEIEALVKAEVKKT